MTSDRQPPPKSSSPLFEPVSDTFNSYPATPQLQELVSTQQPHDAAKDLYLELKDELAKISDRQDYYDALRQFKRRQHRAIQELEDNPFANRKKILNRISLCADVLIRVAYENIQKTMTTRLGRPSYLSSYKQLYPSELAIVGMGKLGACEMNYESDIDLVFIFSHVGETIGASTHSNTEYFAKFAQRFINLLSVLTDTGRCYNIDVELRPSGNAGPLVTSFEHFLDHQMNRALQWERLALLRARPVVMPQDFGIPLKKHLTELAYERPVPKDFFAVMAEIRKRVLDEKVFENSDRIDLKLGAGGLMDVEFAVQGLQLKFQNVFHDLRCHGLFEILNALNKHSLAPRDDITVLRDANLFYRTVESQLHLLKRRSEYHLDLTSKEAEEIAVQCGLINAKALQDRLLELKNSVQQIFTRIYHAT